MYVFIELIQLNVIGNMMFKKNGSAKLETITLMSYNFFDNEIERMNFFIIMKKYPDLHEGRIKYICNRFHKQVYRRNQFLQMYIFHCYIYMIYNLFVMFR